MNVSLGFGLLVLSYSDNLPYAYCEHIGKEIRDISDEIPFEIPESWEWCRVKDLTLLFNGKAFKPSDWTNSGLPIVRIQNLNNDNAIFNYYNGKVEKCFLLSGEELLFAWSGTPGTSFGAHIWKGGKAVLNQHIFKLDYNKEVITKKYFMYVLNQRVTLLIALAHGSAGLQHVTKGTFENTLIPLPPLAEQKRIVEKIEQLLPFIEKYEQAETQLTALNTSFPEMLKKSILQEAVQGKLVPQNPDDEPASVLLQRIRAEKQALVKAGKIKKDKHESVIVTRDKIPYEIPDNWEWCKLSDLAILENGDRSSKYPVEADYVESGIPFFGAKDIDGDMMNFQNVRFISQQKYDELGNGKLVDGDIICLLRGSVGKTAKFEANEQFDTGFICAQMLIIRLLDRSLFGYISSYFKSPDYMNYVESKITGTAVRQMPAKEMGNLLIPLPPLAEQKRIVEKIEELMQYCDKL